MWQGDVVIKTAVELILEDMRKNPWLVEDCFRALIENPYLKDRYGMKEIQNAKDFINNNDIPVYLHSRIDKQDFPCITISINSGSEAEDLATLGDLDYIVEEYKPSEIGKTIPFILKPFQPVSFNSSTGIIEVPTNMTEYKYVDRGMYAINPETGEGYEIIEKAGDNGFRVAEGAEFTDKIAVIPQYGIWRARRERIQSRYSYNIGCHVHGSPSTLIFLFDIIKYGLLRYRESLFEANGFNLSTLQFSDLLKNNAFGEENIYSRWITLKGIVEESWVKGPKRVIETIDLHDSRENVSGLTVAAGKAPDSLDLTEEPWFSVEDNEKV